MEYRGNKGEWSELYAIYKLLAEGVLYAGNEYNEITKNVSYPIIKIIREEVLKHRTATQPSRETFDYNIQHENGDIRQPSDKIRICRGEEEIDTIDSSEFLEMSNRLLKTIQEGKGKSFYSTEKNEGFMKRIHCSNIKMDSTHKGDITFHLYDTITHFKQQYDMSVKSLIGSKPTLLNASDATLITYRVVGGNFSNEDIDRINSITGSRKLKRRLAAIHEKGAIIEYKNYENKTFLNNLQIIDWGLPQTLAHAVLQYFANNAVTSMEKSLSILVETNPLQVDANLINLYKRMLIKLLLASALGMFPSIPYDGSITSNGYIIVKKTGDIVSYFLYKTNLIEQHLFDNTKFDTPSSEKDNRKPYCKLIRTESGEIEIQLNFQIRWK